MKERPILFNGDMVRAILSGQKTQTRRPMKPQPVYYSVDDSPLSLSAAGISVLGSLCPFGDIGDRLWVKETFAQHPQCNQIAYKADHANYCLRDLVFMSTDGSTFFHTRWKPSIHMPRSLSRITLEITDINVERVQDITEEDARAEGVPWAEPIPFREPPTIETTMAVEAKKEFRYLWDSFYVKRCLGWESNPWVWAVKFKRVEEACTRK